MFSGFVAGLVAVISVSLIQSRTITSSSPNFTVGGRNPADPKSVPIIVTCVPPATGPPNGLNEVIVGS